MKRGVVGFALMWDGARWPVAKLPVRAREFLRGTRALSMARCSKAFREGTVEELRICWVPRLKGGTAVLCDPFPTRDGRRVAFRMRRMVRFGDVVGVAYSRSALEFNGKIRTLSRRESDSPKEWSS